VQVFKALGLSNTGLRVFESMEARVKGYEEEYEKAVNLHLDYILKECSVAE
jgi:hypothetical protein